MWSSMCWREGSYLLGDGGGVSCDGVGDFDGCVPKTFSHDPVLPAATHTQAQKHKTVKASHMQKCSMCMKKKKKLIWSLKHPPLIAKPSSILAHMCVSKPACIPTHTYTPPHPCGLALGWTLFTIKWGSFLQILLPAFRLTAPRAICNNTEKKFVC